MSAYVFLAPKHRVVGCNKDREGVTETSETEHQQHGCGEQSLRLSRKDLELVEIDPKESDPQ